MPWVADPKVTIGGTDFTGNTLNGVQVSMGRPSFWDQPRAGYATVNIINYTNASYGIDINQTLTVQLKNTSGVYVTVFTGTVISLDNVVTATGSTNVVNQQVRAIGPMAKMSRVLMSGSFPKEFDSTRLSSILTASGVTVDTVDTPGVYELQSVTKDPNDCYSFASYYANMTFGYIYETSSGKVGFANETRRNNELNVIGHLAIPKSTILGRTVSSSKSLSDLTNDVQVTWRSGTATNSSSTSITNYGRAAARIDTELHNSADAAYQAEKYITIRATPQVNLNQFTIQLDVASDSLINSLLAIYIGRAIQITALPNGISQTTFTGFVENHQWFISENQVSLTIGASDDSYSINPTRWQDVNAALTWDGVAPTLQWQDYD